MHGIGCASSARSNICSAVVIQMKYHICVSKICMTDERATHQYGQTSRNIQFTSMIVVTYAIQITYHTYVFAFVTIRSYTI